MKRFLWLILFFPAIAHADIINIAGMETGDTGEFQSLTGTAISVTTNTVRTGTYALRCNATTSGVGAARLGSVTTAGTAVVTGVNASTGTTHFYFQYATKPASKDEEMLQFLDSVSTVKMTLRLNSAGNVVVYNNPLVAIATGTTALNAGTWYAFDVLCGSGTAASYAVKINNVVEVTGTGNMFNNGTDSIRYGKQTNRNSQTIDFFYDDIVWSSVTYPVDGQILMMVPNANGSNQTFTIGAGAGSHWQIVNEVPSDGDTSYLVSTAVTGSSETERFQSAATIGISGTINYVRVGATTEKDGASNGNLIAMVLSGTTTFIGGGAYAPAANYIFRALNFPTDPNSSTAGWTIAALNAIEGGVKENSSTQKSRVSSIYTIVDFTPSSGQKSFFYIQ